VLTIRGRKPGGPGDDCAIGLAVDAGENVYVGVDTASSTGFTIQSAVQPSYGGGSDGFVFLQTGAVSEPLSAAS
jgi:hypothetical protein